MITFGIMQAAKKILYLKIADITMQFTLPLAMFLYKSYRHVRLVNSSQGYFEKMNSDLPFGAGNTQAPGPSIDYFSAAPFIIGEAAIEAIALIFILQMVSAIINSVALPPSHRSPLRRKYTRLFLPWVCFTLFCYPGVWFWGTLVESMSSYKVYNGAVVVVFSILALASVALAVLYQILSAREVGIARRAVK